ncbi:MAG: c-type cytochrome domain-containing protein, partial [Gemmataceae bacterium]
MPRRSRCHSALAVLSVLLVPAFASAAPPKLQYNRDIRPILAENCFACHGPDSASRKAGLRIDQREAAIEKGAITPGKIAESELVDRLFLADTDDKRMPPPKSHKTLKPAQKEILKQWVIQGAEYEAHWSFIAPKPVTVPAGAKHPVDAFLLAEL